MDGISSRFCSAHSVLHLLAFPNLLENFRRNAYGFFNASIR